MKSLSLYSQELMARARSSRYRGRPAEANVVQSVRHPQCGDVILIHARIEKERVTALGFEGDGCLISQAGASLYLEYIHNRTKEEILALSSQILLALLKIELGPTRQTCALLSYHAVRALLLNLK